MEDFIKEYEYECEECQKGYNHGNPYLCEDCITDDYYEQSESELEYDYDGI